jgi:hypothetical protein
MCLETYSKIKNKLAKIQNEFIHHRSTYILQTEEDLLKKQLEERKHKEEIL